MCFCVSYRGCHQYKCTTTKIMVFSYNLLTVKFIYREAIGITMLMEVGGLFGGWVPIVWYYPRQLFSTKSIWQCTRMRCQHPLENMLLGTGNIGGYG